MRGKPKKGDLFDIPDKKYPVESKVIAKMSSSALKDLVSDQEKYINHLIDKVHPKSHR